MPGHRQTPTWKSYVAEEVMSWNGTSARLVTVGTFGTLGLHLALAVTHTSFICPLQSLAFSQLASCGCIARRVRES
uniref:Uncharacterized protein n=1 Tax=Physcomitrium patens TaxID=3218 RepID=A0A2K1KL91_PHYPA|nr:hypothetical protein PHYPA_008218 [Physcomitrium patens]